MEIRDQLSGFKGPLPLKDGAILRYWQMTNSDDTTINRYAYTPLPAAKAIDRWLLVLEKHSGSTATWVSCLAGKQTFWVRNPSNEDQ